MLKNRAIILFNIVKRNECYDLEVPLNITANDLVTALNSAYGLNIDVSDMKNCYLKAENPIALLKGNTTLGEYGIRNGTIVYFTE